MTSKRRRLAAILVGDLVGYTAAMAIDESNALATVARLRAEAPPIVERHGGVWVKDLGDGFLARFDSAVEAVEAAIEIQRLPPGKEEMRLRVGIHLGDVIISDDDVVGDGVNVAARLELLSVPGGITVSGHVHDLVRNQSGIETRRLGVTDLVQGVTAWALAAEGMPLPSISEVRRHRDHSVAGKIALPAMGRTVAFVASVVLTALLGLALWSVYSAVVANDRPAWGTVSSGRGLREGVAPTPAPPRILVVDVGHEPGAAGGDAATSAQLNELLRQEIRVDGRVAPVPQDRAHADLELLRLSAEANITPNLARQIALRRPEVRAVLSGDARRVGTGRSLVVELVEPASGETILTLTAIASRESDLLPSISDLVERTLAQLPAALAALPEPAPPLVSGAAAAVTTDDTAALDAYLLGYAASRDLDWPAAHALAQSAIERDPSFAMAHLLAGVAARVAGHEPGAAAYVPRAAVLASAQVTDAERRLVVAADLRLRGRCAEAYAELDALRLEFPAFQAAHDDWPLTSRSDALLCLNRVAEARAVLEQRLRDAPTPAAFGALITLELRVAGDLSAARRTVLRLSDPQTMPAIARLQPAIERWANGELAGAEEALGALAVIGGAPYSPAGRTALGERTFGSVAPAAGAVSGEGVALRSGMHYAALAAFEGDLETCRARTASVESLSSVRAAGAWGAIAAWQLAWLRRLADDEDGYRRGLTALASEAGGPTAVAARAWLAVARAGDGQAGIGRDFDELIAPLLIDQREVMGFRALITAEAALANGDALAAVAALEPAVDAMPYPTLDAYPSVWHPVVARVTLAQAYEAAGRTDAAIREWRLIREQKVQAIMEPTATAVIAWLQADAELQRLLPAEPGD